MQSKTGNIYNYIQAVSFPRSGHHLLERLLVAYFKAPICCDYYGCCRSIPCAKGYPLQKNHDKEGTLLNDAANIYVVQLRRSSQAQLNGYFRFFRDLYSEGPREFEAQKYFHYFTDYYDRYYSVFLERPGDSVAHHNAYKSFVDDHLGYYRAFVDKWLLSNANANSYLLFYEDLLSRPATHLSNVIRLLKGDEEVDGVHLSNVISEESLAMKHDLTTSPFYDPAFNERYCLPEIRNFPSGPLFQRPSNGKAVTIRTQVLLTPLDTPAEMPAYSKTAVFILNHNLPDETDDLYSSLVSHQGRDYDLFVLDNGSNNRGQAKHTTHKLKNNIFWGGALNWAFRFIIDNSQYDSLLFLNNDLSLNGAGFVTELRKELFTGAYQLISPCLAGASQPWPQMQCWYSGTTRPVKWIDMQAPLFHRMLIERIGHFDESLKYGWGQELVCARICETNSWSIGVADHICVEHYGKATLEKKVAQEVIKGQDCPVTLEEFGNRARAAYEDLIQSDSAFFRPLVRWGHDYKGGTSRPSRARSLEGPTRTDIINRLIKHFNYQRYLELGVQDGQNFNAVEASFKVGVDPNAATDVRYDMPSDRFFASLPRDTIYDIIFLDGLHDEQQVLRDIHNSLRHLAPGGVILVHDCNPAAEAHQLPERSLDEWCGTTWKAWARLRCKRRDLQMFVIDADWGIGIIRRGTQMPFSGRVNRFDWQFLSTNRRRLLNLVTVETFFASLSDS